MNTSRRAFLALAQNAVAAAAIGAVGVRFIDAAEAMPIDPNLGLAGKPSDVLTEAQWWGPPPAPGWGAPGWGPAPGWGRPPRRRRRWACWWHRGRRHCGWRWY